MPATISFLDMSVKTNPPGADYLPDPIIVGPSFQANDLRILMQGKGTSGSPAPPGPPTGYTNYYVDASSLYRMDYRRLAATDTDTFVQWASGPGAINYSFALCTARGVDPTWTPTAGSTTMTNATIAAANSTPTATTTIPSISVPAAGAMILWVFSFTFGTSAGSQPCSVGVPAGWTNLVATPDSGSTYYPYSAAISTMLIAKSFSSSGSTGSIILPYGAEQVATVFYQWTFVKAAPDVSATAGNIATTTAVTAATFSTSTAVTLPTGSINTTSSVSTAFNPLSGSWVSDALTLPGTPVTGSVVRWASRTPAGTTCVIETSINNGASWDVATNNSGIPRLVEGDTATQSVIARVTLTRSGASDPPPRVLSLELQVSSDSGVDELVAIGHGMIDKVTVHAVGGTTGSGSSTSVATSTAVASRGGGQTGSGTSIKVHVTDLSLSIKRNVWPMPYTIPGGLNYGDAVKAMVLNRLPSQTDFSIASTTAVLPEIVVFGLKQGGDPWQDIQDLATAIGYECFFDPRGVFTFRPVPDPRQGIPVWVFDEDANPVVVEASRELSDEQTFNHIVVEGQSTSSSNPVSAEAFDNDPSSQTYILGDYGEVTQRLTFPLVITLAQAQATANALLFNSLGAADTVTITCVPMPALEPGDIVKIKCSQVKANGTYMINSMTTSLSPADPQQLVCFRQSTNT